MGTRLILSAIVMAVLGAGCLSTKQNSGGPGGSGGSRGTGGVDFDTGGRFGVGGFAGGDLPMGGVPSTGASELSGGAALTGGTWDPGPPIGGWPAAGGLAVTGGWISMPITGGVSVGGAPWVGGAVISGGWISPPITGGWISPPVTGGVTGTGSSVPSTGGIWDCDCAPTNDPCVNTYCDGNGECVYESFASDVDDDSDGVSDACDCDDNNPDVYPGQTAYFDVGRDLPASGGDTGGMGTGGAFGQDFGFDYDCNYWGEPRLWAVAGDCALLPGTEACVGDGWLPDDAGVAQPGCGVAAPYQACNFQDGGCVALEVQVTQTCR